MKRTVHKTCNLCEATCGLLVDVEDDRIARIRGDDDDPFSRGHVCPKAVALGELHEDPDRLRYPVRRTASGDWERIPWSTAIATVAEQLTKIQDEHGNDAVASYLGNPGAHNFGTIFYLSPLYAALDTRNVYAASSLDQNPAHASSLFLFGSTLRIPVPDLDRSDFVLMLGANPVISNGSLMTAPGMRRRVRELRERGAKLVVVDPRRTETAKLADDHLFIRPGQDALLLAALLAEIFEAEKTRKNHVWDHLDGLDALKEAVTPFRADAVATSIGISAERIRELAHDFASADSAACYGRVGVCLNPFGTLNSCLIHALNAVTGNLDSEGGSMFPDPAIDLAELAARVGSPKPDWKTRVRGAPSFNGEQPSACLAEEMATPGEGQVRGLLTVAGNPALSAPNGPAVDKALAGLEFYCAVDFYINESTRHAHVILPPTGSLEHDNYEVLFHLFAVRNTAKYSRPVLDPAPGTRHEWQILTELATRIQQKKAQGALARWGWRLARRAGRLATPRRLMDASLRAGPYGDGFRPWRSGLRLRDLERHRKGVDLGPLNRSIPRILRTPGQRIDLAHPSILEELRRLRGALEATPAELVLIGRRDTRTNNSWLHNVPVGAKGPDRCTLIVHPEDAKRLGLTGADRVSIRSRIATRSAKLQISDDVMPGVVCLPHGFGHSAEGMRMSLASSTPGINFNDLSDDAVLEGVVGNAVLNGIPVSIEAAIPTEAPETP
jgi:anaerobic selenocysteine-containing dehydrogenase